MRKPLQIVVLVVGLLCVVSGALSAQDVLTVTPTQLKLAGVQGQTLSRSVVVQSASPLSALTLIPLELTSAEDHVLQPSLGDGPKLPTELMGNVPLSMPLRFDLTGVPAGIYTGEVLVTYTGGSRSVPVQVSVKAPPWGPLATLVAGVALGIGVSNYRAKGRPRDAVMVRLGQLRTQMKVDEELRALGRPFYARLTAELVDVEAALEAQQWEQAQKAAEEAAKIWTLWRRGRPDWIVQLTAYTKFVEWLGGAGAGTRYVAELRQTAEDIYRNTPDLDGPQMLRAQILPLTDRANTFIELESRLQMLEELGGHGPTQAAAYRQQLHHQAPLDAAAGQALQTLAENVEMALTKLRKADLDATLARIRALAGDDADETQLNAMTAYRTRIDTLPAGADAVYVELLIDLEAALQAVRPTRSAEAMLESGGPIPFAGDDAVAKGLSGLPGLQLMAGLPQVRVHSLESETLAAKRRMHGFTWTTYGVAVIMLALAGFVELYSARADFGAKGISEYFTLLAWGFGAEATRSAVADMIQSWGVVRQ